MRRIDFVVAGLFGSAIFFALFRKYIKKFGRNRQIFERNVYLQLSAFGYNCRDVREIKKRGYGMGIKVFMSAICAALIFNITEAKDSMELSSKEKNIALAAAYAAKGDCKNLKSALAEGLDTGVTVAEYKEVLVQLYAYCGFPRSLNALGTFMGLLKERNGDVAGRGPSKLPDTPPLKFGADNQTKLIGAEVKGEIFEFAPAIDRFLKAHLFGDIFGRDNLDWRTREIATVAMLAAMDGVESQLASHIAIAKHNGVSDSQIGEILRLVRDGPRGMSNTGPFPFGAENVAYSKYFSGKSYLAPLSKNSELGVPIANVTFEPGCRNNWHSHTGGQILIAVGGKGFYQEKGKPARPLKEGDIVEIPPNVVHWHGASPDSWFSHLAIECNPKDNKNTWLEPVSDAEYAKAVGK